VAVEYAVLSGIEYGVRLDNVNFLAGETYRRTMSRAAAEQKAGEALERYRHLLDEVYALCGVKPEEAARRRQQILAQIATVKAAVSKRAGRSTVTPDETIPHVIIADISPDVPGKLAGVLAGQRGVVVTRTLRRSYPLGLAESVAHIVGTEGAVSEDDLADDPFADDTRRRYLPNDRKGLSGIERSAEAVLRGWRGVTQTDRDGKVLQHYDPVRGGMVRLTIDADLQKYLYQVLGYHVRQQRYGCGGAIVVINLGDRVVRGQQLRDGDILALVSYPSYDPNSWRATYDQLLADERRQPTLHRAVGAVYPPGSIIKPAVLAAALAEGKIRPTDTLNCPGYLYAANKPFKCWIWPLLHTGHGDLTPSDALKVRCNVFFYKLGQLLTLPTLTRWLERFDLGRKLEIGLAEEQAGTVPTPLWLATHRDDYSGFSQADAANVAIGQGELGITPLAAANMMATIARGCKSVAPRLIVDNQPARPLVSLGVDWGYVNVIHEGMRRVVNDDAGTAKRYAFMDNVVLAGKTGSAQCSRRRIGGELFPPRQDFQFKRIAGEMKEVFDDVHPAHAWFAGFAPADHPTVAIACVIEYGMSGGATAGPMARKIIQLCINLDYVGTTTPDGKNRAVDGVDEPVVPTPEGSP
jgi:penicillin-binding protein 2